MSISIDTPEGPVLVDLTQDEFARASQTWDPRKRGPLSLRLLDELRETSEPDYREAALNTIVEECIRICQEKIGALNDSDAAMDGDEELENWQLELNTWKLCGTLLP